MFRGRLQKGLAAARLANTATLSCLLLFALTPTAASAGEPLTVELRPSEARFIEQNGTPVILRLTLYGDDFDREAFINGECCGSDEDIWIDYFDERADSDIHMDMEFRVGNFRRRYVDLKRVWVDWGAARVRYGESAKSFAGVDYYGQDWSGDIPPWSSGSSLEGDVNWTVNVDDVPGLSYQYFYFKDWASSFSVSSTFNDGEFRWYIVETDIEPGPPVYTVIDLGTLGYDAGSSWARDINNHGHVVGSADTDLLGVNAFVYKDGSMRNLGSYEGPEGYSVANAINDAGLIVGTSTTLFSSEAFAIVGFIVEDGQMRSLFGDHQDADGSRQSTGIAYARDINKRGAILFQSRYDRAGIWVNGFGRDFPGPVDVGLDVSAMINDRGNILIGDTTTRYEGKWQQRGIPHIENADINYQFLSNTDKLLGSAFIYGGCSGYTPVCTEDSLVGYSTNLGDPPDIGEYDFPRRFVMNDYGQAVIDAGDGKLGLAGGWRPNFELADVADLSAWQELRVTAINNLGQFVGSGRTLTGAWRAFLATPEITPAEIDIEPGDSTNFVDPLIDGVVRVAVLTTSVADGDAVDFDAKKIDPKKVRFGDWSARIAVPRSVEDVDNDSDMDVVFGFRAVKTGIKCDDTDAYLYGETYTNEVFAATGELTTDCEAGCHP